MKFIITCLLLAACTCFAQKNSIELYGVGNFNPTTVLVLTAQDNNKMISSNRSSFGGALEYDRWITKHVAVGALCEGNPSSIHFLLSNGLVPSVDPVLIHFETVPVVTERAAIGPVNVFIQEGAGAIVTYGPQPGWSHDLAWTTGGGLDYPLSKHISGIIGAVFLNSETGCYGDHTCKASWGVTEDGHAGLKFSW